MVNGGSWRFYINYEECKYTEKEKGQASDSLFYINYEECKFAF